MHISGKHVIARRREELFEKLLDPALLLRTIPGCESLVRTGDHAYDTRLSLGFGPIKGTFTGTVLLKEVRPPQSYRMEIRGEGKPGFLIGAASVELQSLDGGARTEVRYQSDVQVGGLLASVGARLIPGAARTFSDQFFAALEKALDGGTA